MVTFTKKYWFFVCVVAVILSPSFAQKRTLTKSEAQELVTAAISSSTKTLPGFGFDDLPSGDPKEKDFYIFEASFKNPGGMQVIGQYAVHKVSGIVWKVVGCRQMHSDELHKLQTTFRKRIGISPDELKRLADESPCYQ